jgi:hypothetical protein
MIININISEISDNIADKRNFLNHNLKNLLVIILACDKIILMIRTINIATIIGK